jgi:predicted nucleic acid-binding protein
MKAVDSSVVIAAFASWHESHDSAREALTTRPRVIAHAAVETYSVLTRLPHPHRALPSIAHEFLAQRFDEPLLSLSAIGYREFLATIASTPILGSSTYDALIAYTAIEHEAVLVTLDQRAATTYEAVGAVVEQLDHGD